MRKKEPPSPSMAATEARPPLSPAAYAEALENKRLALEREIADYRARKEDEFKAFQRRLSTSVVTSEDTDAQKKRCTDDAPDNNADAQNSVAQAECSSSTLTAQQQKSSNTRSPSTSKYDTNLELRGLFLPHFIPLLDEPHSHIRKRSPLTRSDSAEIPAQPSGVKSQDPSTFSPRTSPSPTLLASPPPLISPTPLEIPPVLSSSAQEPLYTASTSSNAIPNRHRPAHLRTSSTDTALLAPNALRPGIGTRSSSSQSEASNTSISLRSSLRKSSSVPRSGHKKKNVRISIGNVVMAPSESPVQTRSAFRLPQTSQLLNDDLDFEHLELGDDRGRIDVRDERAGKARIDDEGGARRRRKKRVGTPKPLDEEPLDYFPPQPLRSPRLATSPGGFKPNGSGKYVGSALIEPTVTTPTTPESWKGSQEDDFDIDDPLFGGGDGWGEHANEKRQSGKQTRTSDEDEEDLFRDDEDGREDMDVVNGHDLVEDEHEDDNVDLLPSPSPHASSMPIGIKGPSGWRLRQGP